MNIYVDIDNTICTTGTGPNKYESSTPLMERIAYVNGLYDAGNRVTYWTARGNTTGQDHSALTKKQLEDWGCRYHELKMGQKPSFDLLIDDKAQNPNTLELKPTEKKQTPQIVPKGWGHEVIFVNNDKYCGKILHFNTGGRFSMHYHLKKQETWYVASGRFQFKYIDTRNADILETTLNVGDSVTNQLGEPHQIICLEEGDIFEVSTTHYDSDSYRVMKGDSQKCGH